jgi:hypothetical protein
MGTFDDNRAPRAHGRTLPPVEFDARPADRRHRLRRARSSASRSCPADPSTPRSRTATRPTTSRSPGWSSGCARSAPEGRHRRLRRARLHPRADRRRPAMDRARPAAQRHPRLHAARLRHRRRHQGQRHTRLMRGARGHARRSTSARPRGRCSRTSATRSPRRAGLRRHLRERAGRAAHRLPVPARQPARRHRARHRRPVRARARLVHLRRRRPDVALQRQRRRAEDADPAPDPLGDRRARQFDDEVNEVLQAILDTEISPELVPVGEESAVRARGQGRPVRAAGLHAVPRAALRLPAVEDRVPGLARLARRRARATGRPASRGQARRLRPGRDPALARGLLQRFFAFSQFKRSALPNGPKVSPAARCRRAATGARRRTEREVPED